MTTRRTALTTIGATMMTALTLTPTVLADPELPPAATVALIDQAEGLLLAVRDLAGRLSSRDASNLSHGLERLADALVGGPARYAAWLAEDGRLDVGPGQRIHDQIDAQEEAERRAAVTHAPIVAAYAAVYHTGEVGRVGTAIRAELAEIYGEQLGHAIDGAAFHLAMHRQYHDSGDPAHCARCLDDA